MTTRDYVRRGKPAAKKKPAANKTRSPSPPRRRLPWLALSLALLGCAAFGWFLYQIDGDGKAPATQRLAGAAQSDQPVPTSQPAPSPAGQDAPREEWQYMKELPQKRVEVEVPEIKQETRPYLMQCGSFRSRSQAEELKAMIAFQGLSSQVRESNGKNGTWFRVILGPYERKRLAEKDRHLLARGKIRSCQIWFW